MVHDTGQLGDGDGRRVRREDGVRADDLVERLHDRQFEFDVLGHRLDHQVGAGDIFEIAGECHPGKRGVALVDIELAALDAAVQGGLES